MEDVGPLPNCYRTLAGHSLSPPKSFVVSVHFLSIGSHTVMDDDAWDNILDEELAKLDAEESENTTDFFPAKRDCTCCVGYMNKCECVARKGHTHCIVCDEKGGAAEAGTRVSPEYDAAPDQPRFSRAVEASAAAVESQAAPTLSRNASLTSTEDIFNFSVKIFPPAPSVLSRDMFKMMFLPAVTAALGNGPRGENLTWPDRGWRNSAEFTTEMDSALQKRTCHIDGIVVARMQTREEAMKLAEAISNLEVWLLSAPPLSPLRQNGMIWCLICVKNTA